jgi:hypothetical protein
MTHVPFRGAIQRSTTSWAASMIFSSLPPTLGNIKSANLRALGHGYPHALLCVARAANN